MHSPLKIHFHQPGQLLLIGQLGTRAGEYVRAGVIHPHINPAKFIPRLPQQPINGLRI